MQRPCEKAAAFWAMVRQQRTQDELVPEATHTNEQALLGRNLLGNGRWKDTRICHVHPRVCSVHSIARCTVMNISQYNGAHSCAWCEQEGEKANTGRSHAHAYPMQGAKLRTHGSIGKHAEREKRNWSFIGVSEAPVFFLCVCRSSPFLSVLLWTTCMLCATGL